MPWLIADARPELVRGILSIEPSGPPFREAIFSNTSARPYGLTDIPLTYDPPVAVMLETSEASYHAPYDHCTVEFLKQTGVQAEHLKLADLRLHGNGHLHFMELNNLEIIAGLGPWLAAIS